MLTVKQIYLCMLLFGCSVTGWTQQSYRSCYGFGCREKKWDLSVFAGYPVSGMGKDIKNELENSGSNLASPGPENILRCFPKRHLTETRTALAWNIEARYLLSRKNAISFAAGKLNGHAISAFAEGSDEQIFELQSNTYSASLNYIVKLRRGGDELNVGPVVAWHQVNTAVGQRISSLKAGVNVGYTLNLIKTKNWSLGIKTNYTWLPDAQVGPYTINHELENFSENSDVCTSTMQKTNIKLQTLQFGLTTGWRF